MTLTKLDPNCWAKLSGINLPWEVRKHLMELGILSGAKIKLICKNPFGKVFLIQVEDTHIAISKKIAKAINIECLTKEDK
jgi:Fe2+ transport system protein FeoA